MLKSKGKTCMVEEPSHVKQLSLNYFCKIGLITTFIFADNCSAGMVESGYSYEGLPDPASYYPDSSRHSPDFGPSDHQPSSRPPSQHQQSHHQLPQQLTQQQPSYQQQPQQQPSYQQPVEGLQTPNTRAKRVVHEVIV
jgi:hypothetical protein